MGESGRGRGEGQGSEVGDIPVDKQEVGHKAQQGGHSGGNRQVALKVVLETHRKGGCLSLRAGEGLGPGLLPLSSDT